MIPARRHFQLFLNRLSRFRNLDVVIYACGEEIPEGHGGKEETENHRLHRTRCLRIGEFEGHDGDEDFGGGQQEVGKDLPSDVRPLTGVDPLLDGGAEDEGSTHEEQPGADFPQGGQFYHLADHGIDEEGEEGNEGQNQDGVYRLDL